MKKISKYLIPASLATTASLVLAVSIAHAGPDQHGAMHGQWRKYTLDGKLFEEVTMINNEEMGPFKEYHPNGKILAEGTYLHGPNEDGRLKLYDESGQLQKEMVCDSGRCYTVWKKE